MKQHKQVVYQTQNRFNDAFNVWINSGAPQGGKEWGIMFECVVAVCSNVAKAMTKKKHFINDIDDKAMACACAIMEHDIYTKHVKIEALGAYVRDPLMNYLWHKSVIRREHDSLDQYQKNKDKDLLEYFNERTNEDNEELLYLVDGKCMSESEVRHNQQLIDDVFLSEWGY